jgi:1-deoxy-D-xylulose-5-phosphate reductoisomerase
MQSTGVAILGSTGSIGCNTLRVVASLQGRMHVVALAAGSNIDRLAVQIERHLPELVSVETEELAHALRAKLFERNIDLPRIVTGEAGLVEVATHPDADCVVSATVGAVGFLPTLRALEAGKRVALANKETLVMAGELMTRAARQSGAELLPVDSEHNALHQCLRGERREEVRRIILTASGGPFRTKDKAAMKQASVAEAMQHPTWNMGAKITIDSATLMNKGLEVIEARWLFGFGPDEIDILVHPESVVHSMIELIDGSVIAQMGITDMRHAIQYALTYPERHSCQLPPLDLTAISGLHFEAPDPERFPCIALAYRALSEGGTLPAAMNAANEVAVGAFIEQKIGLTEIPQVVETVMNQHVNQPASDIEIILAADVQARRAANGLICAIWS